MAVIYVREQGTLIRKNGGRLMIGRNAQSLMEFPVSNIEGLALMGNVQITAQALHFLLQEGVDISHYSYGGQYLGQTAAESSKNISYVFPSMNSTIMNRKDWSMPGLL